MTTSDPWLPLRFVSAGRRRGTARRLVIGAELGPVQKRPEDVRQSPGAIGLGLASVDVLGRKGHLFGLWTAGQCGQEDDFDPADSIEVRRLGNRPDHVAGLGPRGAV